MLRDEKFVALSSLKIWNIYDLDNLHSRNINYSLNHSCAVFLDANLYTECHLNCE